MLIRTTPGRTKLLRKIREELTTGVMTRYHGGDHTFVEAILLRDRIDQTVTGEMKHLADLPHAETP